MVKAQHMPNELSADEVAAHNMMHEPFSLWCRACVTSRGLSPNHFVSDQMSVAR